MIFVHDNVSSYKTTKPTECPICGFKRAFDVPVRATVSKAKRGRPPPEQENDIAFIKCKKCGNPVGISMDSDIDEN